MWIDDFVGLIFPRICAACGNSLWKHEQIICGFCHFHLPRTSFHQDPQNPVSRMFWGKTEVIHASSFLLFNKGNSVQNLIHALKYRDRKDIGVFLGKEYGRILAQISQFSECDVIVPVPLHRKKFMKRGYNQSEQFAIGLSSEMKIPCLGSALSRRSSTETQTHKSKFGRWQNVKDLFFVGEPGKLAEKRVLLVDDVITTGATLEACIGALSEIPGVTFCLATIAYSRL